MQIEIPEVLLTRLQKHAVPFVDTTPVSVIERWGEFYDRHHQKPESTSKLPVAPSSSTNDKLRQLDSNNPPSLLHSTARGEFGTTHFTNWNDLLRIAHLAAFKKSKSFSDLRRESIAQIYDGNKDDEGYRFLPEIGISLQGVDANRAWRYSLRLAKYVGVPIRVVVDWRHNEKSAHPGERALLFWKP